MMLDPRTASIVYTPLDLRNRLHPTVGRLLILPTAEVAAALDPAPRPGDHEVVARPVQANTYSEVVPVVADGEDDVARAMLAVFTRLVVLDGLDAGVVAAAFGSLDGWATALADGRVRGRQRIAAR